ncbi:MAG: aldolase/citrate lyase family protein [Chloroflexota bacterium]
MTTLEDDRGDIHSSGEPLELALFVKIAHSAVVRTLCAAPAINDLILDAEHGAFSDAELETLCELITLSGRRPVVRVASPDPLAVGRALDRGAQGVMIPRSGGLDDTLRAIEGLQFAPKGLRGWDPTSAAFGYGAGRDGRGVGQARCFVQIETSGALRDAADIAALPAVTDLFVGPADLARALGADEGIFGQAVLDAVEDLARRVPSGAARLGLFVDSVERGHWARSLGYRYLAVGSDVGLLNHGARAAEGFLA